MLHSRTSMAGVVVGLGLLALVASVPACGGGAGGPGPEGAGQGLVLVGFLQAGVDNLAINTTLELSFSEAVDASTVNSGTIQVREGPDFGATASGTFHVAGSKVYFEPVLPTDCALQTAGLKPGKTYRIVVVGFPEEFCVKNSKGQPLNHTSSYEISTLPDTDDGVLRDQKPGSAPSIVATTPEPNAAAVAVGQDDEVVIDFSENIDPCTVNADTVKCSVYEVGDPGTFIAAPNGNMSGFTPATDSTPNDPYTWGATNSTPVSPPQVVPVNRVLEQTSALTRLRISPVFGQFPDNALVVVQMTFGVQDFGGQALGPTTFSFTTENHAAQAGSYTIPFDASTPVDKAVTTADVNTARSPGRVQAWLLFAGDGDNGGTTLTSNLVPSFPKTINSDCSFRSNSGVKFDFDPASDVNLNTGSSRNRTCSNETDGSTAVIWEFSSFRIRSGVTVRIVGQNPAVILVQGDAIIESGGRLLVRGDKSNGAPDSRGGNAVGYNSPNYNVVSASGGDGVAGAGDGGASHSMYEGTGKDGDDGYSGFGSEDYDTPSEEGGLGAGQGQVGATSSTSTAGCSGGGGGAGHASVGSDGGRSQSSVSPFDSTPEGEGGGTYPSGASADKMYTPSAGSGGGGGGENFYSYTGYYEGPAGGGGAGGGFVDLTSGGDIRIYGTIDAAGGDGGTGATGGYTNYLGGGGGGGGSGGGIRLLTPGNIDITGATITAAGGQGGLGGVPYYQAADFVRNDGGTGGLGRIVMENGNSIVTGYGTATVIPGEGQDGFYRGPFDPTRFQGGGLEPVGVTGLMLLGPVTPPTFQPAVATDFVQGIPSGAAIGNGKTSMLVELRGYPMLPDGTPNLAAPIGWYTVGYFASTVTGSTWYPESNPGDVVVPGDNMGAGIANLNGSQYVQARIHFWLPSGISPTAPGPWIDSWTIHFQYDN